MKLHIALLPLVVMVVPVASYGQETVCDLFKDLDASDGRQVIVSGDVTISKDIAVLGAADCEYRYETREGGGFLHLWPTGLYLRPSADLPPEQIRQFRDGASRAGRLREEGKTVNVSALFSGRLRVIKGRDYPAELTFDSFRNFSVTALTDSAELPVLPICELFQNLPAWNGKRVAVRGEASNSSEGSWIVGNCKGAFYTDGYRWPVMLDSARPAYYAGEIGELLEPSWPSSPPKGSEMFRGRNSVVTTATYVGRLRMQSQYMAACREDGSYATNGFGHLNGAAAELVVEAVRDVELTARTVPEGGEDTGEQGRCAPPNLADLCLNAATLTRAASLGCTNRVREILGTEGIDSKNGSESASLNAAIRTGREDIVRLLIEAGAPVNPLNTNESPLADAASWHRIGIMKVLLSAGADVQARNRRGEPYLATLGFFFAPIARTLLGAGANPNGIDRDGQTALMHASAYGYEDVVRLLIEYRADVDIKDNRGRSALMHSAAGPYVDAIPHLLASGADVYARDRDGKTALDIARESKNAVAVEMLSKAMANPQ